jgi:aspartyl-tRNA(Asn)/glutamyl-tRNA(Gln) amidotransferase subunit A
MKIGLPKEYFMDSMDKEVKTAVKQAADYYKSKGAQVVEISLLDPKYAVAVYTIIQRSEVSSNLQRFDGIRYGNDRKYFGDEAKRRIMLGTFALSAGYYDQYYKKAQKVRRLMVEDFAKVFKQVNLIIAPTAPVTAMKIGSTTNEPMFGEMQDILVEASSLAGLPGINLNCGFSSSGLPIGMQIIGPQFSEKLIINTAYTFEQATNWHTKKPNLII